MQRDSIDWGTMHIPSLFRKIFIPTLLGMLLASTMNIVDGAVVGQGVGSNALAAINIVAPFFLITTGVGLMFGSGVSIVAAVHLARGRQKAVNINVTQAFTVSMLLMVTMACVVMLFPETFARLLGGNDELMPYIKDYMRWVIPAMPFGMLLCIGLFVIRFDGSPMFAMICNIIPAVMNGVLDYVFVFPCRMGIEGASLATGLSELVGALMIMGYMLFGTRTVSFYKSKFTRKSILITLRNIGYQVRLGAPSMIGELAIACMMLCGNYAFITYLGEDGVAAFSVACYCFPLVFMVGNAIAQSGQPIISYNYGAGLWHRVRQTMRLSLSVALVLGLLMTFGGMGGNDVIVGIFIPDGGGAHNIAVAGLPYFASAFVLFSLNLVCIGYFQSLERFKMATFFMLLRGLVFVVPSFMLMPLLLGDEGLWLAVPVSELFTLVAMMSCLWLRRKVRR